MCDATVQRLLNQVQQFEQKYGWSSQRFLQKFEAGEIGDDYEFFVWYALAQGIEDWQKPSDSMEQSNV